MGEEVLKFDTNGSYFSKRHLKLIDRLILVQQLLVENMSAVIS